MTCPAHPTPAVGPPRRQPTVPDPPLGSLDDLIDGAESDVRGATCDTFDDLVHYCRQVAGSVARMSVAVLGSRDPVSAAQLADDLGVAMQLTTILRDLVRDFQQGRVYLPREDLALSGCPADPLSAAPALLERLIRHQARRNREWYDRGLALLPLLDARGAAVRPSKHWPGPTRASSTASSAHRPMSCADGSPCPHPREPLSRQPRARATPGSRTAA